MFWGFAVRPDEAYVYASTGISDPHHILGRAAWGCRSASPGGARGPRPGTAGPGPAGPGRGPRPRARVPGSPRRVPQNMVGI